MVYPGQHWTLSPDFAIEYRTHKPRRMHLSSVDKEDHIDVIVLQETHFVGENEVTTKAKISGYGVVEAVLSETYGTITYARCDTTSNAVIKKSTTSNIETITIELSELRIESVSKLPNIRW
ncbi:hypothetical protein Trydic_g7928 [Trypoxylus dichotomus]